MREQPIRFKSAGITLSGTLVIPATSRTHPAVVIFHGSGSEARNLKMARWFAQQGVAALTYDKRGVGESQGDYREVPFTDLADDGLAGIQMLKSRRDIDPKRIGVWGISQGGWLGPLAASRSRDVAFVIAISGPGVSPGEQMIHYFASQLRAKGVAESDIAEASALRRQVWRCLSTGADCKETRSSVERAKTMPSFAIVATQDDRVFQTFEDAESESGDRWFKAEVNYDPTIALRKLSVPALFIFGDRDWLVPVARSVDVIRRTLAESGHKDFTIRVFEGADHGIQVGSGPAPGYLELMKTWLAARVAAK